MKHTVDPKYFSKVVAALVGSDAKKATCYVSEQMVVKATWRHKPKARNTREECVVTFGAPNFLERRFIKLAKQAKEPFPVRKVLLTAWPKKRSKTAK